MVKESVYATDAPSLTSTFHLNRRVQHRLNPQDSGWPLMAKEHPDCDTQCERQQKGCQQTSTSCWLPHVSDILWTGVQPGTITVEETNRMEIMVRRWSVHHNSGSVQHFYSSCSVTPRISKRAPPSPPSVTWIVHPCASTISLTIPRPNPVPASLVE